MWSKESSYPADGDINWHNQLWTELYHRESSWRYKRQRNSIPKKPSCSHARIHACTKKFPAALTVTAPKWERATYLATEWMNWMLWSVKWQNNASHDSTYWHKNYNDRQPTAEGTGHRTCAQALARGGRDASWAARMSKGSAASGRAFILTWVLVTHVAAL